MSLTPGARIGAYEIVSLLGAGGMGEVFRARDTKLNRDVAIKVLLAAVAGDPERLARFQREAQLLASVNHPHIAAVFGVEDAEPMLALVMELVEGPTLAERLTSGPIPMDEALSIARQTAEALEAAHDQGIIHRDLKPANVKVRDDGTVKVLDFGLAKVLESPAGSHGGATMSPTLSMHATQAGLILGTAAYMAPEQARGRPVDRRADIWAFGLIVFEMLTGRRAFEGDDISITLAAVLKDEVDWNALPADTPPYLSRLLRRCLQRDPRRRLPHIGLARIEIEEGLSDPQPAMPLESRVATDREPPSFRKRAIPVAAAAIAAAALTAVIVPKLKPTPPPGTIMRFRTTLPQGVVYLTPARAVMAMSPDGSAFALGTAAGLFVHTLADGRIRQVVGGSLESGGAVGVLNPVFSPDGRWIAYFEAGGGEGPLRKVAVTGGAPIVLCRSFPPFGASWADGQIVFATGTKGIQRVSENGGSPETIVPASGVLMQGPQMLPGGDTIIFSASTDGGANQWDRAEIVAYGLKSGVRKTILTGGSDARYVPTGHLVYALSGVLFAVPFDARTLSVKGGPVPVVEGIRRGVITGAAMFGFSNDGTLAFLPGPLAGAGSQADLVWTAKDGSATPLKLQPGRYETPRLSPDGRQAAVVNTDAAGVNVWIVDLTGVNSMRRLTYGGRNRSEVWSPDGQRIAFQSDREGDAGIFVQVADGTASAQRLTRADNGVAHLPESWSPDGTHILFSSNKGSEYSLWTLSVADGKTQPFGGVRSGKLLNATFSPDGKWIAYGTDETGVDAVFVQPFPATTTKYQISSGDVGHHAVWSRDGKQLYYIPGPTLFVSVNVATHSGFAVTPPVPAPRAFNIGNAQTSPRSHDIAPDGRFLGVIAAGQPATPTAIGTQQMEFVINWFEELKQRVPVK
jgi:serine/threonine protein kinase/Tol biopolymer transport system component